MQHISLYFLFSNFPSHFKIAIKRNGEGERVVWNFILRTEKNAFKMNKNIFPNFPGWWRYFLKQLYVKC